MNKAIKNNKFIDNYRGIRIENSVQPKIIGNEFKIKGWDEEINIYGCYVNPFYQSYDSTYASYGLMLDKSSGYTVEGNDFSSYNGVFPSSNNIGFDKQTGIVVSESGPAANELYGNRFHDLLVGIRAQGVNGQYGPVLSYGLDYKCNEFEDEIFTACIGSAKGAIIDIVQGKMQYQPFPDFDPAGNLLKSNSSFSNPIPDQFWIDSDYSTSFFQYVHHIESDYTPQAGRFVSSKVIPVGSLKSIEDFPCDNNSMPFVSPGSGSAAFSRIGIINYLVDSISQILEAGNQDSLYALADSDSLPLVYSTLSAFSPYLSHRVLKKLISKAKANATQEYFDLLIENSPLSGELYEHCEGIDFDSLQWIELDSVQEGYSPLTILQNNGSNDASERDRILYKQIELWLDDELDTTRYDKVINLLALTPTLQAKFEQIDYLIMLRAYSEAFNLLDSIGLAHAEWSAYTDLYKDILPVLSMPGSWYNLPSDSSLVGRMISHVRDGLPGSIRMVTLLDFCSERFSCEDIQALKLPDESSERKGVVNSESYKVSSAIESLNIFPNPNSGKFAVLFKSNNLREGTLKLMGISGNTVLSRIIIQANQEFQLNLEGLPKGIYILQLEAQDQFFTRKIIVE
jgi:parallel beta-helix repeat protein